MGKYRKRFNEKARAGMLAKQAALKKARNKQFTRHLDDGTEQEHEDHVDQPMPVLDPNAEILKPLTEAEKAERKRKLEETLYSANERETKMSKAKKKRLDKYIEHQIKREEKRVLLNKLSKTKMDTTNLVALKNLGKGKQTKREEMIEALSLEQQGRADDRTRNVLYEEHEVKDWSSEDDTFHTAQTYSDEEKDEASEDEEGSGDDDNEEEEDEMAKFGGSFVDNRPAKFGGSGSGFGFGNLPKVQKDKAKKKYSWRLALEREEKKRKKVEDENDFVSTDEEDEKDEEEAEDDEIEEEDGEEGEEDEDEDEEDEDDEEGDEDNDDDDEDDDDEDDDDEEDEEEDDDDEDDEDLPALLKSKPKHSKVATSFKEWAEQQVRQLEGRDNEVVMPTLAPEIKEKYSKPTIHEEDFDHSSDEEGYVPIDKSMKRDAFFVNVLRDDEIQNVRMQLPVFAEEHRIMEAVNHHDCIVVCGETGSGKTTQVPQFLYEAGFGNLKHPLFPGMIGITQPRRVAAVSMARRVGNELGDHGHRVGHQIRFDTTIKNEGQEDGTAMKFMTDGVLLREMMSDFMLSKYSCLIIDEAHERNINTDILIGMLSRVLKLRRQYHNKDLTKYKPLKLIIMSATLRVSDFSENTALFSVPPPILKVDARQYPVSVHFNKRTPYNYVEEAAKKAIKIHKKLPPGGILIFLTGQNEITTTVRRLRREFPVKGAKPAKVEEDTVIRLNKNADAEAEEIDLGVDAAQGDFDDYDSNSDSEEEGFEEEREEHQTDEDPLHVLPLYSLLPTKEQMKVFENPPEGSRLCIVATNVAETSLTIPGIRYVVDCGRSKERKFNEDTGVQSFEIDWISKASADQRAGRAGRTGPGHCYRLYSSAVYESYFAQFSRPEILRMPFESVVLSMKTMGIDQVQNFPFPTVPDRTALNKAEKLLVNLGALDSHGVITELGRSMSSFPLSPRFAKILIVGNQMKCLPYVIAIVSALSVGDPFIGENELGLKTAQKTKSKPKHGSDDSDVESSESESEDEADVEARKRLRSKYNQARAMFAKLDAGSDVFALLSAVCAVDHVPRDKKMDFMQNHFLRVKTMEEIGKLRKQVDHIVQVNSLPDSIAAVLKEDIKLGVPDKTQLLALKQMVASGFVDQVAIRADLVSAEIDIPKKTTLMRVPYTPVFPVHNNDVEADPYVYIHPGSVAATMGAQPASYLVYLSLSIGANTKEGQAPRVRMRPLVDLSGRQLANVAKNTPLLTYSKPLGHPYAPKNITATKRECYVVPRFGAAIGTGGMGWDLPAIKVVQEKKNGSWVIV